jgi:hypothetical protein
MRARLIPWCLAATGFLAALTVFTWQGKLGGTAPKLQLQATAGPWRAPPATDHHELLSSPAAVASQPPQNAAAPGILPLPPATQPELDPNLQPVPDDEPTVDDLPARQSPTESPTDE